MPRISLGNSPCLFAKILASTCPHGYQHVTKLSTGPPLHSAGGRLTWWRPRRTCNTWTPYTLIGVLVWWLVTSATLESRTPRQREGSNLQNDHDDVIRWKHFPRHWPFVRGIHRSPVNSLHKGHWGGALMLSFICVWTNGWADHWDAGDLKRHRTHNDVTVMVTEYDDLRHNRSLPNPVLWSPLGPVRGIEVAPLVRCQTAPEVRLTSKPHIPLSKEHWIADVTEKHVVNRHVI